MDNKNREIKAIEYPCNGKIITFNKPLVMAIVNITPDSFYDGGKYGDIRDILCDAEEKIKSGADILDLGAASSRPGAIEVTEVEEWARMEKILTEIRKQFPDILISVDTYRAKIARQGADCGADIINDVSGGNLDENMFTTVAELNLPYIMMHMAGTPQTMQQNPIYSDVVKEIKEIFASKIKLLKTLNFTKIILDPGFGFGKTTVHNFTLLKEFGAFLNAGYPLLAGLSRKGMINKVIGTNPVTALNGTTVVNTIALLNGASILRVHDVNEAVQAIKLVEFYESV